MSFFNPKSHVSFPSRPHHLRFAPVPQLDPDSSFPFEDDPPAGHFPLYANHPYLHAGTMAFLYASESTFSSVRLDLDKRGKSLSLAISHSHHLVGIILLQVYVLGPVSPPIPLPPNKEGTRMVFFLTGQRFTRPFRSPETTASAWSCAPS